MCSSCFVPNDSCRLSLAVLSFTAPFNGTAHAGDLLARSLSGLRHLQHGVEQIARRIRHCFLTRNVQPAAVLQLKFGVESKEIWRKGSYVIPGSLLRFVPAIRKRIAV